MGAVAASFGVLADAISSVQTYVRVFASIYSIVIFIYILTSWVRLPYSPTTNRVLRFLEDVCAPYIRLFRRILPPLGPLDLSPMVALIVLWVFAEVAIKILDEFH